MNRDTYTCTWCGVQRKTRPQRATSKCRDCRNQTQAYEIRVSDDHFWQTVREIRGW